MKTVGISRLAMMFAVAGTIFASGASGCVVHERSVRVVPHPYPVVVGPYPPRPWYAGPTPRRWSHGCDNRRHDCQPRYQVDRRDRGHGHKDRFRGFDG